VRGLRGFGKSKRAGSAGRQNKRERAGSAGRKNKRAFETTASARIDSAEAVLAQLRDPSTWHRWQSEIVRAHGPAPLEAGDHVAGDARMLGFAVAGRADVIVAEEREVRHDVLVGIRMSVRYTLEPSGDGWILTHRLGADLPRGISGRVLSFFLRRRLERMQTRLLHDLVAAAAPDESDRSVASPPRQGAP
jgi:Polyketide cyclase / dehydrase and lipid transport